MPLRWPSGARAERSRPVGRGECPRAGNGTRYSAAMPSLGDLCRLALLLALLTAPSVRADAPAAEAPASGPAAAASDAATPPRPAPYGPAVAARFSDPVVTYDVPVLAAGRQGFTGNTDLAAQLAAIAASAPAGTRIERLMPGRSARGTPIEALHFSRGERRPAVLLLGQQHGDEPAGAEALLIVARSLARGALAPVLDHLDVTVLPRANPDGAEVGRRENADGQDINRDHLLLRTPEARALAALARDRRPVVVVDAHEHTAAGRYLSKFGAVQRYDMLLQYAMTANLPEALGDASERWFRQPILAALATEGMTVEWYYSNPSTPGDLRMAMGGVQRDTARNVYGLRHAVSLLLESRGVGIGRLHLARRVHSQVVSMATVLRQAARHADELASLQAAADAKVMAAACGGRAVVRAVATPTSRTLLMLDPVTGADKPVEVDWTSSLALRVRGERSRPCGYWLAADQLAAVAALHQLGLKLRVIAQPLRMMTEAWIETARGEVPGADDTGSMTRRPRTLLQLAVDLQVELAELPAGSWYLPLDQPLANLAIAALEPDTQDSYLAHRLIDRLGAVRRVLARPSGEPPAP